MSTAAPLSDLATPSEVAALEARASRHETPCGDGVMVWRAWGAGPPLLLIHGGHGAWSHWIRNIDALAQAWTVWAPDLPGCGESAMPPGEDMGGLIDALAAGLHRLIQPPQSLDVVGFSFGGVVGAELAARRPALVRRLVLVDSGGLGTPLGPVATQPVRGLEGDVRGAAVRANLLTIMLHAEASVDELALYLQETNAARGRLKPRPLMLPHRLLDTLPRVGAQVDAIWGERDGPHPDPEVQMAALRRLRPDLDFQVVAGAGHWVMYERAEAFNRALIALLRQPLRDGRAAGGRA